MWERVSFVTVVAVADNQEVLFLAAGVESCVVVAWEWTVLQIVSQVGETSYAIVRSCLMGDDVRCGC